MSPDERATLAALADLMIPADEGMPAASDAGVPTTGVDYVLSVRPDLAAPLRIVLDLAADAEPNQVLASLEPDVYAAFGEIVAGAYYLDPGVRDLVSYHGRAARPVEEDIDKELLAAVIARGPIYRADPRD